MEINLQQQETQKTNNYCNIVLLRERKKLINEEILELTEAYKGRTQQQKTYKEAPEKSDDEEYRKSLANLPPEFSEGEISERFTRKYGDVVKYVEDWGHWIHWNGMKWQRLDAFAFDFARNTVKDASCELKAQGNDKAALIVYSNRFVGGVLGLARKNIKHFIQVKEFDNDDMLLNTPRGIVDLQTGKLLEHNPKYLMTKMTAVAPDFEMATPIWDNFFEETLKTDTILIGFLQRLAGYFLTGTTKEEVLPFIYGIERTGKTTFVETISRLMGEYATMAVIESLTHRSKNMMGADRHSTDIAKLRGARLARAAETEDGRTWTAAKIKELTGGDTITARLMRQDNEDFIPKCKLLIHGNHKPKLKDPEGIKRRLLVIVFNHQVKQQNKNLKKDLENEYPGILAWMIKGCLEWQKNGLEPPKDILDATNNYFDEQETVKDWLAECCEVTDDKLKDWWTKSTSLYNNYKKWFEASGEHDIISQKAFSLRLEGLGLKKRTIKDPKAFKNIKLKIDLEEEARKAEANPLN